MEAKKIFVDLYERNRYKDDCIEIIDRRTIPGLVHHNLIKLCENDPWYINCGWLIFFSIIALYSPYKCFFNSCCIERVFKIRKLVSRRYDLRQAVKRGLYLLLAPHLNLTGQELSYDPNTYNYINSEYNVNLPTKEELKAAEQYNNKVPIYHLSSDNDAAPLDVIIEDNVENNSDNKFNLESKKFEEEKEKILKGTQKNNEVSPNPQEQHGQNIQINTLNINQQIKNQGHSSDNQNQQGGNAVPIQQCETQTNACLNVDDLKVMTANNVDPRSETRGLKSNRKVKRNSLI